MDRQASQKHYLPHTCTDLISLTDCLCNLAQQMLFMNIYKLNISSLNPTQYSTGTVGYMTWCNFISFQAPVGHNRISGTGNWYPTTPHTGNIFRGILYFFSFFGGRGGGRARSKVRISIFWTSCQGCIKIVVMRPRNINNVTGCHYVTEILLERILLFDS